MICARSTSWVLELDIQAYFDSIVRENLVEMMGRRVTDGSMLRLIGKWISVGAIDGGKLIEHGGTGGVRWRLKGRKQKGRADRSARPWECRS